MRDSRPAQLLAKARLQEMGFMTQQELIMAGTCGLTITLWVLGGFFGEKLQLSDHLTVTMMLSDTTPSISAS